MKILVAGGSGFIGKELLSRLLKEKHSIVLLTRDPEKCKELESENIVVKHWDGKTLDKWALSIESIDAVINLSGQSIADKRWDNSYKKLILDSRINTTRVLVEAINKASKKPKVFINSSAIGYYGDTEDIPVDESFPKGIGFLAEVVEKWEHEATLASKNTRVALLRIGVVLEKDGGAIKKMLLPFQFFAGGPLGNGNQWIPWIHKSEVVNVILYTLTNPSLEGPINVVSPNPATMKDFCSALGKSINRPSWVPVPSFAVQLMIGEMAELLLGSFKVIPKKLLESGYKFSYTTIDKCLENIFNPQKNKKQIR